MCLAFSFVLLLSFFSPESLVTTIVGFLVSIGLTHVFKNVIGLQGAGAAVLAFVISFVVAIGAVVISGLLGGSGFSWDTIASSGTQIFALATIAYKLFMANSNAAS